MKKITSFLLMLTMLISIIIYIPEFQIQASAEETSPDDRYERLPDGTKMIPGKYIFAYEDRMPVEEGDVGELIMSADDFKNIKPGGKYSLGRDITLENWEPLFFEESYNTAEGVRFDGGGYTITTDDMLFYRLPKNSVFANFVIAGDIVKPSSHINGTFSVDVRRHPYDSLGALCSHMGGGTVKNVINKANVTATPGVAENYQIRVSGLIGSCTQEPVLIQNCHNRGKIQGSVHGTEYAVAGLLGYAECSELYIMGCRNDGQIINASTSNSYSKYAGGIVGTKPNSSDKTSIWYIIGSSSVLPTDKAPDGTYMIQADTNPGSGFNGCAALDYPNTTYVAEAYPVPSSEAFSEMKGDKTYYLTETFIITDQNKNHFTGTLYGGKRKLTAKVPPFAYNDSKNGLVNLTINLEGWTRIRTPGDFYAIRNDGTSKDEKGQLNTENKYYLDANIDLSSDYPEWQGPEFWSGSAANREHATNDQPTIILDGCGYTVTTAKPIFPELPGGAAGNDGTHSIIRNLVIAGDVRVDSSLLNTYNNSFSAGALVGKANGGIFENITNNANVTLTSQTNARIGGIIGSAFVDDLTMVKCVNNGIITAPTAGDTYGVGGVIGLVGYDKDNILRGVHAKLVHCENRNAVRNTSNASADVYAGGIVGVKYVGDTEFFLIDCSATGKIFAKTSYGRYFSDRLQQNSHVIKTIPISTKEEFMNISGRRAYSLTKDIELESCNINKFEGFLLGNGYSISTPDRLFKDSANATFIDVDADPTNFVIDGNLLENFTIVASAEDIAYAEAIRDHLLYSYDLNIPIKAPDEVGDVKDAIYINMGNTYGGETRFGFDYGYSEDGYFKVYLDGKDDAETSAVVNDFILNRIPKGKVKTGYDFFEHFGDKMFTYAFDDASSSSLTFHSQTNRDISEGVTYLERIYNAENGATIEACVIVINKDSNVHLELVASKLTPVDICNNSDNCHLQHVEATNMRTVEEFAQECESQGKKVVAAVNGGPFINNYLCTTPWGMQIVDGTINKLPWEGNDGLGSRWFGVKYDGTPVCGDHNTYADFAGQLQYAVGGGYYFIENGNYVNIANDNVQDARTAIGYNSNGDIVIVSVAGKMGDVNYPGITHADIAQIFMDLDIDITYALSLGGGSSTAMMVSDTSEDLCLETPQYSSGVIGSDGQIDITVQRKITDALVLVRNEK